MANPEDDEPRLTDCRLLRLDDRRVADVADFDGNTGGLLKGRDDTNTIILAKDEANKLMESMAHKDAVFVLSGIDPKKSSRSPPKPFITSTLQQAGSSKLRLSPSDTMRVAQELYEEGYITYMRTDSPSLSSAATQMSRDAVEEAFGPKFLGNENSKSKAKKAPKNAQEAHEAIRPAEFKGRFRTPAETKLEGKKKELYGLIYRRTLASVMSKAEYLTKTYSITSDLSHMKKCKFYTASFRASERVTLFEGYNAALYMKDTGSNKKIDVSVDEKIELIKGQSLYLAKVLVPSSGSKYGQAEEGAGEDATDESGEEHNDTDSDSDAHGGEADDLAIVIKGLVGMAKTTKPPNRFSESSFIKELETIGVGRPSTYSKVIDTLRSAERKYVTVDGHTLVPTITGLVVNDFLQEHFPDLTMSQFTAQMEDALDLIAQGKKDKIDFLTEFYLGKDGMEVGHEGLLHKVKSKLSNNEIDHFASRTLEFPPLEGIGTLRIGSSGAYFEENSDGVSQTEDDDGTEKKVRNRWKLPEAMQVDIRKITKEAIAAVCATETTMSGAVVGETDDGEPVTVRSGRYGKFLQVGRNEDKTKKYHSLPKWLDIATPFEKVLEFSTLPRKIGEHPELRDNLGSSRMIVVEISGGAVSVGVEGYPLRVAIDDMVFPSEVTIEVASALLSDTKAILDSQRILGKYEDVEVSLRKGRFGYYVRCGKLIAGLRKLDPDDVDLAAAIEMIQTRGKEIGSKSKGRKKAAPKAKPKAKSKSKAKPKAIAKATSKVSTTKKRAPSAYITFSGVKREELKKENPDASFGELSKLISKSWAALSEEQQSAYKVASMDEVNGENGPAKKEKKPPSAYINFCNAKRPQTKQANPDASFGELSKILSSEWGKLDTKTKESYKT
jgi:DNA topoisomerase I